MKPLQLSMKAFGAFAEECRIDFTPFNKSGIYLITGETGAGKTTIFDAICYALYGTASGDVRDPKQFRSQYADPKQITCVELRFFCGNKQYLVNRTPPYLRAALRGSGMVEQKAEAELWEILPDKTAEKKKILCSGAQAVTDKVVELTGMDGKQFRQIVMIAQGEFRKFLLSSSVEKGKILRQLFHTQNCDKIQQILKERLDQQRAHVREQETQMLTLLHQASPAGEKQAELYEARLNFSGMAAAEELCDMLKTSAAELSEQAASQSEQVQEQQKAIESLLQEIEQGRQHNAVLKQLRQAEQEQQKGAVQLELCEAAAKKADADAEKVPELQEQVTLLQHSLPKYEEVAVLQAAESALQMKRKTQELACAQAKLYWEQTTASCQRLSKELEVHVDSAVDCANLEHAIEKDTQRQQSVRQLQKQMTEQQKAQKELERRSQRAQQAETWYFSEEKPAYDRTERQFFQSMAGNLARKLKENEPCPVCGSREHSCPALYTEDTVTEEQFQKAKERQQNALQQMEEHKKSLTQQEERCKMLEQQVQQQLVHCGLNETAGSAAVQQLAADLQAAIKRPTSVGLGPAPFIPFGTHQAGGTENTVHALHIGTKPERQQIAETEVCFAVAVVVTLPAACIQGGKAFAVAGGTGGTQQLFIGAVHLLPYGCGSRNLRCFRFRQIFCVYGGTFGAAFLDGKAVQGIAGNGEIPSAVVHFQSDAALAAGSGWLFSCKQQVYAGAAGT